MEFKIDAGALRWLVAEPPEQRRDFDTGQPKTDRETGAPLYQVRLLAMGETGAAPIRVGVIGDPGQHVAQTAFVRPVGLTLNVMEKRGDSIMWWTVERLDPDPDMPGVIPAPAVAPAQGEAGKGGGK
ncbi:hypothetical protein [Actinomadura hibisca]|uniref:hypothetical protein n=1 Tax=Actinomadura hibisca TaxID=68565 RepID=UPI000830B5EC|nr:hypothetical protein [Actinomadura hibisca]